MHTPSSPSNKSLDVVIPMLPRDKPVSNWYKWGAVATKSLCYAFSIMAEDSATQEKEIDRLSQVEEQLKKDLNVYKAKITQAKTDRDMQSKCVEELKTQMGMAQADLEAKDATFQVYQKDMADDMDELVGWFNEEKAAKKKLEEKNEAMLARIAELEKKTHAVSNSPGP